MARMSPIIQTQSGGNELLRSIESTYRVLRIGLGVIALLLPPTLYLFGPKPLLGSMSAYYYTDQMRDVFVGVLFATGATLGLYKGFSGAED